MLTNRHLIHMQRKAHIIIIISLDFFFKTTIQPGLA